MVDTAPVWERKSGKEVGRSWPNAATGRVCVWLQRWKEKKDTMFSVQEGCSDREGCAELVKQIWCCERDKVRWSFTLPPERKLTSLGRALTVCWSGLFINLTDPVFLILRSPQGEMVFLYFDWPHRWWKIALWWVLLGSDFPLYLESCTKGWVAQLYWNKIKTFRDRTGIKIHMWDVNSSKGLFTACTRLASYSGYLTEQE